MPGEISLRLLPPSDPNKLAVCVAEAEIALVVPLGASTGKPVQNHPMSIVLKDGRVLSFAGAWNEYGVEVVLVLIDSRANEEEHCQFAVRISWDREDNRWEIQKLSIRPGYNRLLASVSPSLMNLWDLELVGPTPTELTD